LFARTEVILVIPKTKQIASRIFDFPDPLRPVIALKDGSNSTVRELDRLLPRRDSLSILVRTG
jgi:hypothetical protein